MEEVEQLRAQVNALMRRVEQLEKQAGELDFRTRGLVQYGPKTATAFVPEIFPQVTGYFAGAGRFVPGGAQ